MTEEELNRLEALATHSRDNRYAFAAIEPFNLLSLIRLARVGLAVAKNAKLIDAVLEQADADSYTVEAEFSAGSDEQYEKERAAIAHVRTMLLSALPKPGGE